MLNLIRKKLSQGPMLMVVLVVFSAELAAADYVPPPTGPYQSSVIISDKNLFQSDNGNHQVYRFPTEELIRGEKKPLKFTRGDTSSFQNNIPAAPVAPTASTKIPLEKSIAPSTVNPSAQYYPVNPWEPKAQSSVQQPMQQQYPDNYQYDWGNQSSRQQQYWQQPYRQQYPYGYSNQNNYMNTPFNSMPSPWSAMPMQPFFSGR
jgi:hypothetical protein